MDLAITVRPVPPHVAIVEAMGEMDASAATMVQALLADLSKTGVRHVVLAAHMLSFCDFRCMCALAALHHHLKAAGGSLSIAQPSSMVRRVWSLLPACDRKHGALPELHDSLGQALISHAGPEALVNHLRSVSSSSVTCAINTNIPPPPRPR